MLPFRSFAVIPAAGRSVRMGRPKLLLPWGDATVMESVLEAWSRSLVTKTVVVAHRDDQRLIEICRSAGADVVIPETPPPEMKRSVQAALRYIADEFSPGPCDAWLLAPADMPTLSTPTIDRLLQLASDSLAAGKILVPTRLGRKGHPVLFPWLLAVEVHQLGEHEGVNALLQRWPVEQIEVEEPSILDDLDTPDDHQRLLGLRPKRGEAAM